jgi:hypothetical protein
MSTEHKQGNSIHQHHTISAHSSEQSLFSQQDYPTNTVQLQPNASIWRKALFYLFQVPLFYLYLKGPDLNINGNASIGFWSGRDSHDICAEVTRVAAEHWRQNSDVCDELIQRRFMTYYVFLEMVVYIILTFSTIRYVLKFVVVHFCSFVVWLFCTALPFIFNFLTYRLVYRFESTSSTRHD